MNQPRNIEVKSAARQIVEARLGEDLEIAIRRLYLDERLTQEQVAERLDVSRQTLSRWMREMDIPARIVGRGIRKAVA